MNDLDRSRDLHALMDRALTDVPVPTSRLQWGALRTGRRLRRRRRSLTALGALAATTVIGLLAIPSLAGGDPDEVKVAREPSPAPTHDSAPTPSRGPSPSSDLTDPTAGWWDMPGRVMRDRLAVLIPATLTVTDANLGNEELAPGEKSHGGWVMVDVEDDRGRPAGGLNVLLYPPLADGAFPAQQLTCPGNLADPATPCTEIFDADGDPIGRSTRWEGNGVVVIEQALLRPDGGIVYAAASNSSDDKWGEGSSVEAEEPPVTAAQLKAIALSPRWTAWKPQT